MKIWKSLRDAGSLMVDVFNGWNEDKAWILSAALSFFTILSLSPLLIIALSIAGVIFSEEKTRAELLNQLQGLLGPEGIDQVRNILSHIAHPKVSLNASIIGIIALIAGASGVFLQLKITLNAAWHIEKQLKTAKKNIWNFTRMVVFSIGLTLGTGFLLLVSLLLTATLSILERGFTEVLPLPASVLTVVDIILSFVVVVVLFALIFKYVPDSDVWWRDVIRGAVLTAILFNIGKFLIGIYLGNSSIGAEYGAAASLVIFLIWIYFSAQIFFFGAEFIRIYAQKRGRPIRSV